jgi:hypothetical protein
MSALGMPWMVVPKSMNDNRILALGLGRPDHDSG